MGELHLEILVDRMLREFKVEASVGKPQVAYKETIRTSIKAEGKFVRQTGGRGQYGHVWLEIGPNDPGVGFIFENKIVGGVVPREYITPVERGVKEALEKLFKVPKPFPKLLPPKGKLSYFQRLNNFLDSNKDLRAIRVTRNGLKRTWYAARLRDDRKPPYVAGFIDHLARHGNQ